jgi:filamentous hemagglutinin family protein
MLLSTVTTRLAGIGVAIALWPQGAIAQIIPDHTLGAEQSQVVPLDTLGAPADVIEGGALRGSNLFHSFQEFNVSAGRGVYFRNISNDLQNILARVTGSNRSEIMGNLGILNDPGITSHPNLYLINPNGIIFGPNASLNIGGSFVTTTADAIRLGDQGLFSAATPAANQLLSIQPSALQFNRLATQPISIVSSRLQVPAGRDLVMVGGHITLDQGQLFALGGHIALGGVSGSGTINLDPNAPDVRLLFPESVTRSDVTLANGSIVGVPAGGGGSINITARQLDLSGGSQIVGGIIANGGSGSGQAGEVVLDATDTIRLTQGSRIANAVEAGSSGNGGDLRVTTGSLILDQGSVLGTATSGIGNAGNIFINARDRISLDGTGGDSTGFFAGVNDTGQGNAGNLTLQTGSLSVTGGAIIGAGVIGRGNAGGITINARDRITLDGSGTLIFAGIDGGGQGTAGNATLQTVTLSITGGAALGVGVLGQGNGGNLTLDIRDRTLLDGRGTTLFAGIGAVGRGNAGNIALQTRTLSVTGGATLGTGSLGEGNGGDVKIQARDRVTIDNSILFAGVTDTGQGNAGSIALRTGSLSVTGGSVLGATTAGQGDAGNVSVTARDRIRLRDPGTSIVAGVDITGRGNAGDVTIDTGSLSVSGGASVGIPILGQGRGGNVRIHARDRVVFDGLGSNLIAGVTDTGRGRAGNVTIRTGALALTQGASIGTGTIGQGSGGTITIQARDSVVVTGARRDDLDSSSVVGIISSVDRGGVGNAGNIRITTDSLLVRSNAGLFANTSGRGNAGSITVRARGAVVFDDQSGAISSVSSNEPFRAGAIQISAGSLAVTNQAAIVAAVIPLDSSSPNPIRGRAGNITINTGNLLVDQAGLLVSNLGSQRAGDLNINASSIELRNGGQLNATARTGQGGSIQVRTSDLLLLRRQSIVTAQSDVLGNDGNIRIDTPFLVAIPSENSDIVAFSAIASGAGGSNIRINAQGVYGTQFREAQTSNSDITATGNVTISLPDIDPNRGLTVLPADVVDASRLINQSCSVAGSDPTTLGELIVTGRGGLPPNPNQLLNHEEILTDWVMPNATGSNQPNRVNSQETSEHRDQDHFVSVSSTQATGSIVEAQAWTVDANGAVALVPEGTNGVVHPPAFRPTECSGYMR